MNVRTRIASVVLALAALAGGSAIAAGSAQAGIHLTASSACDLSPYCFAYTDGTGEHLASKAGFGTEVQATTNASENGFNDDAWYASAGPNHVFQLFRGGVASGLYLNESGGHLVLGHDSTVAFTFDGTCGPVTCTGTWSDSAGRVWTSTFNGGPVNVVLPGAVPTSRQLWTTDKP